MLVTATEFKTNFGKYLELIRHEDIFITKNGKTVAKVSNPQVSAVEALSGLLAEKLPADYDRKSLREERFSEYELND
ncbi:MAG: type II toxin-antitoxin system Phd/YefM family antitoxin [Clostridium sp.]|nr:type II toxin-antitoxin system Phd/YefM family antitoxin [Clostridium sp.]